MILGIYPLLSGYPVCWCVIVHSTLLTIPCIGMASSVMSPLPFIILFKSSVCVWFSVKLKICQIKSKLLLSLIFSIVFLFILYISTVLFIFFLLTLGLLVLFRAP